MLNMEKYLINYNNGFTKEVHGDLDFAIETAMSYIGYTQESITISELKTGKIVATSYWYGILATEDYVVSFDFGEFGFYGEWIK